jgi:hypothetical protein
MSNAHVDRTSPSAYILNIAKKKKKKNSQQTTKRKRTRWPRTDAELRYQLVGVHRVASPASQSTTANHACLHLAPLHHPFIHSPPAHRLTNKSITKESTIDRTSHQAQTQDIFRSGHAYQPVPLAFRLVRSSLCQPATADLHSISRCRVARTVCRCVHHIVRQFLALSYTSGSRQTKWPPRCIASRLKWHGRLARSCHPRISHTARNSYAPKA